MLAEDETGRTYFRRVTNKHNSFIEAGIINECKDLSGAIIYRAYRLQNIDVYNKNFLCTEFKSLFPAMLWIDKHLQDIGFIFSKPLVIE